MNFPKIKIHVSRRHLIVICSIAVGFLLIGLGCGYILGKNVNITYSVQKMTTNAISNHVSNPDVSTSGVATSYVTLEKRNISPSDPDTYFVQLSDREISIRHDVFKEEKDGLVQVPDGRKGNLYPQEIGKIRINTKLASIANVIWSSDGQQLAYIITRYQYNPQKVFSDIYTINKDGTNSRNVGSYGIDNNSIMILVGYYTKSNKIAFFWASGYPLPLDGSFSILDLDASQITKIPEIPIQEVSSLDYLTSHQALKSSPDGNIFLLATNTHVYSYNVAAHQLSTLFTIPQEDFNAVHSKGDNPFSGGFIPIVQIGYSDDKSIYFTSNKIDIFYKTSQQMIYDTTANTIQKPH